MNNSYKGLDLVVIFVPNDKTMTAVPLSYNSYKKMEKETLLA
jgi:hypothetical protein